MAILSVDSISKSFGERTLFSDVSFNVEAGDKVGFVGSNGTGKTTIFKIITGEETADTGSVSKSSHCNIGYLKQHVFSSSEKCVYDEVLSVFSHLSEMECELLEIASRIEKGESGLVEKQNALAESFSENGGYTYKSRVRAALLGLGFSDEEQKKSVSSLSGGERTRVFLCKVLMENSGLLLLDEPTNHLDIEAVEWLEGFLKSYTGAVVIISHDRYFLDRVTNKTIELENGKITCYTGSYSDFIVKKEAEELFIKRHYDNTQKEIKRIEGIIKQQRQWNRERNIKTAESKQKAVDRLKEGLVKPKEEEKTLSFDFFREISCGNDVLSAKNLSKSFADRTLFTDISLEIKKGEKVFLLGKNGCGKTTLLNMLKDKEYADKVSFGSGVEFAFYDQTTESLDDEKTILDEVWDANPKLTQTEIRTALAVFLFDAEDIEKKISALSGGERARVMLLKLMLSKANLLILDEPTNHLDTASREALERALLEYKGTILAVSHDRYFINRLATRVLYMNNNSIENYIGNYDYYLSKRKEEIKVEPKEKKVTASKNEYLEEKERQSKRRKLETAHKRCEAEIEQTEEKIAELEASMANLTSEYEEIMKLSSEAEILKTKLDSLYAEWEKISEELGE